MQGQNVSRPWAGQDAVIKKRAWARKQYQRLGRNEEKQGRNGSGGWRNSRYPIMVLYMICDQQNNKEQMPVSRCVVTRSPTA